MKSFFNYLVYILIWMPILLSLFTVFLLVTDKVSEEEILDGSEWGDDVDENVKK